MRKLRDTRYSLYEGTRCVPMSGLKKPVQFIDIGEDKAGQRIDNFLIAVLKGIPKSATYRILRKGNVRVNKKRVKAGYKLSHGDRIRVPPVLLPSSINRLLPELSIKLDKVADLKSRVLYEDSHILALNKPSGLAVHGGSGLKFGIIEALRVLFPRYRFLELVHRIDRGTSGVLLIAKKRSALRYIQAQFREKTVIKNYLTLVMGNWCRPCSRITAPLLKDNIRRVVRVSPKGKVSNTCFRIMEGFHGATFMQATPITGRTHQIRVHACYQKHPVAGDALYGDANFDAFMNTLGLNRLFLHSSCVKFTHPGSGSSVSVEAPMDGVLNLTLKKLREYTEQELSRSVAASLEKGN